MTAPTPATSATPSAVPAPGPWSGRGEPERTPRAELADAWRGFRTAARLGWQTEANWADPLLFVTYSVAKPVAGALILVFMVEVISAGRADPALRAFVVIGSALWSFVMGGIAGLAMSVLEDRERYRMLKYLYVSPNSLLVLLLGRGLARVAIGGMGAGITLLLGILFLGLPFDPAAVDWPLLALCMTLGLVAIVAMGLTLAAVSMQTRQDAWQYPEAVAGALFLLVGAVFPLAVLPFAVQLVGLITPLTWWLEGVRRALFPGAVTAVGGDGSAWAQLTGSGAPDAGTIALALLATTVLVTLASLACFRWSERRAKERGLFDQTTGS